MNAIAIPNLKQYEAVKALQISITSPEAKEEAQVYLVKIDAMSKQLAADVRALKLPHKTAIDQIDAATGPWKEMLQEKRAAIGRAILAYNNKIAEAVRLANVKTLEKYEAKVEKQESKAIAQGKPIPVVLPPVLATAPPKTEQVDGGKLTTVKRKAWRLSNRAVNAGLTPDTMTYQDNRVFEGCIPAEFFILDTARIGKIVRAGGTVPGIEVFEEESLSVRA